MLISWNWYYLPEFLPKHGEAQLVEIERVGHNELGNQQQFWDAIEDFIDASTGT
jgi:hypothetical protein